MHVLVPKIEFSIRGRDLHIHRGCFVLKALQARHQPLHCETWRAAQQYAHLLTFALEAWLSLQVVDVKYFLSFLFRWIRLFAGFGNLRMSFERRLDIHEALLKLAAAIICTRFVDRWC
jgi:hypothetical protein